MAEIGTVERALREIRRAIRESSDIPPVAEEEIQALRAEIIEAWLGPNGSRGIRYATQVAAMIAEHCTSHRKEAASLWTDAPKHDLMLLTAANLAMGHWLRTYRLTEDIVLSVTEIESHWVCRAFLVGSRCANDRVHGLEWLLLQFKARRLTPQIAEERMVAAKSDELRRLLIQLGVENDQAELATAIVREQCSGLVSDELRGVQKTLRLAHLRQLDAFRECLRSKMRQSLADGSVEALTAFAEHASFRALLIGHRLEHRQRID